MEIFSFQVTEALECQPGDGGRPYKSINCEGSGEDNVDSNCEKTWVQLLHQI